MMPLQTQIADSLAVSEAAQSRCREQAALFYEFSLESHVPPDHMLRSIDRFVHGSRRPGAFLQPHGSAIGRSGPYDPHATRRFCFGIRSERRPREEVHLNLAYRSSGSDLMAACRIHSTFSKNRHGRFRQSDLLRRVFERWCRAA